MSFHEILGSRHASVAVMLATYNGSRWVREQISSILSQKNVKLTLYISDDCSTDSTTEILSEIAASDSRVVLLPVGEKFGSAGKNFYRLIRDIKIDEHDYFAFSDQDDVWFPGKLDRHISLLNLYSCEGISSNVIAFWDSGKKKLIKKSQPFRKYDYLFEAAGPGCTYLISANLIKLIQKLLANSDSCANRVDMHDWLIYAVCRTMRWSWYIDNEPTVMYRQHDLNVIGASSGFQAKIQRMRKLRNGWYREQILMVTQVSLFLRQSENIRKIEKILIDSRYLPSLRLIKYLMDIRRRGIERVFLGMSIIIGFF